MAATSSTSTKKARTGSAKPRVRSIPRHRSFKLSKKRLKQNQSIPGAVSLLKGVYRIIKSNKRLFFGIALLNTLISFIFIKGVGTSFDIVGLKQEFEEVLGDEAAQLGTAFTLFGYLVESAGTSASETAGVYQIFLLLITGLALIWAIRQIQAGEKPGLRESYYRGMYPLIPFVLVLLVIGLQLIPLLVGNLIFTTVLQNGLAITFLEKIVWLLLFIALALLSAYMIVSSIFALYISTLPDMTPMRALRSARDLVLHRRLAVGLRIIALPAALFLFSILIFIPLIIVAAPVVEILFLFVSGLGLAITHTYMYLLYRSLL